MRRLNKGPWEFSWSLFLDTNLRLLGTLPSFSSSCFSISVPLSTSPILYPLCSPIPPSLIVSQETLSSPHTPFFFHLASHSAPPSVSLSILPHPPSVPKLPISLFNGFPLDRHYSSVSILSPVLSLCVSAIPIPPLSLLATLSLTLSSPFSRPLILPSALHLPHLLLLSSSL